MMGFSGGRGVMAVLTLLALGGGPLRAQEAQPGSAAYNACMAKAQTTADMVACMNDEMALQDKTLNTIYQQALAALPVDQRQKLRAAQRVWLDFRQKDCDVFYGKETGTIASVEAGGCMIRQTVSRIGDLRLIAERP